MKTKIILILLLVLSTIVNSFGKQTKSSRDSIIVSPDKTKVEVIKIDRFLIDHYTVGKHIVNNITVYNPSKIYHVIYYQQSSKRYFDLIVPELLAKGKASIPDSMVPRPIHLWGNETYIKRGFVKLSNNEFIELPGVEYQAPASQGVIFNLLMIILVLTVCLFLILRFFFQTELWFFRTIFIGIFVVYNVHALLSIAEGYDLGKMIASAIFSLPPLLATFAFPARQRKMGLDKRKDRLNIDKPFFVLSDGTKVTPYKEGKMHDELDIPVVGVEFITPSYKELENAPYDWIEVRQKGKTYEWLMVGKAYHNDPCVGAVNPHTGEIIIQVEYDSISQVPSQSVLCLLVATKKGKKTMYNGSGKIIK